MLAARGGPQLEASQPAEGEQRLTDGTGCSIHEYALVALHPGCPVQELVRRRPAQDQRGCLRRVEARRHAGQAISRERAIGGVRADHGQIGHAVAKLKAAHGIAELIYFPDDIISQHERRPVGRSLRVGGAGSTRRCTARSRRARGPAPRPGQPSAEERRPLRARRERRSA
jgi:hypothetical protein